jgi:hypothetical protein
MAAPLVKEDLDNINEALKAVKDTRQVIERAKLAGLDVEAQETTLNDSEKRLLATKQAFFPSGRA